MTRISPWPIVAAPTELILVDVASTKRHVWPPREQLRPAVHSIGRWRGRNRQTRDGDRRSDRSSSHQGLDKSRPLALVRFQVLTLAENARWPRQWETKADPHAAGRFTRSVATHSTFGAATVRATARCPLRLRVFRRRARDPRSSAPTPYRQRIASQSREPGIGPPVHYAAMPAQKYRS